MLSCALVTQNVCQRLQLPAVYNNNNLAEIIAYEYTVYIHTPNHRELDILSVEVDYYLIIAG